jgi:hypothetical protein
MITDTQIIEAVRAVLPLDVFAIVHFIGSAPIRLPVHELERATEMPVIGWLAAVLLVVLILVVFVALWGLALAIWVGSVLVFIAVMVASPILAAVVNDALALPRALVGF